MVSTISPVVYRNSDLGRNGWLVAITFYTLGSIGGGVLAGVLLGSLGIYLDPVIAAHRNLIPFLVGLTAIAYAMHEMRFVSLPYPQRQRQVPDHWRRKFHPYMTAGLFGLLLGIGFITFIPMATYYVLSLSVILHGSLVVGAFIFAVYGATRALLLWPLSWHNRAPGNIERITYYMDLTKPIMRQVNGFVLAMAGAYLISAFL